MLCYVLIDYIISFKVFYIRRILYKIWQIIPKFTTENDSILSRPRSENVNISWVRAISHSDPLHGKLHNANKFQVVMWFPQFHLPGPSLSWKISKFRGTPKNWQSMDGHFK